MKRFAIGLMFLAACTSKWGPAGYRQAPEPGPDGCDHQLTISPDFPDNQRQLLHEAVGRWNAVATSQFCLKDGPVDSTRDSHIIFSFDHGGTYWKELSDSHDGADVLGIYFGSVDAIGIAEPLSDDEFELVALHELGHAHGLDHTACPAIMCPWVGSATDFTDNDMTECRRVGACADPDAGTVVPTGLSAGVWVSTRGSDR